MGLRLFADHCVATSVIDALRAAGNEVLRLRELLPTDSPDPVVLEKAQSLDCVLLTIDGDFTDIVRYPPKEYRGIISLQIKNHPEVLPLIVDKLSRYFEAHKDVSHYHGKLFLVEAYRVRVRS